MERGLFHPARTFVTAALVCALAGACPARAAGGYRVIDLGGAPGGSAANGLTLDGFVVGYQLVGPSQPHAVIFSQGVLRDLGTLGGDASLANAVDRDGRVVGWARLPDANRHAFLWADGAMQDLGTLGGPWSMALALNASQVVVGASAVDDARVQVPFVWSPSLGMRPLPLSPSTGGQANDINDAGFIVGYLTEPMGATRAFLYDGIAVRPLPELEAPGSKAYAVNARGDAAGYSFAGEGPPHFHAVLWRDGLARDLGALAGGHSVAYDLDDAGNAVGFSYAASGAMVATLFANGTIVDLNSRVPEGSGWTLDAATGINEDGVIIGMGTRNGVSRAFVLVPEDLHRGPWGTPEPVSAMGVRAWPNPMRDAGTLELALPAEASGRVALYDVTGRRVADLAEGRFAAGRTSVAIPSHVLARTRSGVYYARVETTLGMRQQRIVVVR